VTRNRLQELKGLEGRQVSLALRDGSRMDACQLISAGRSQVGTLWLVRDDLDTFVPLDEVDAMCETASGSVEVA
jgi:hypothetical protein